MEKRCKVCGRVIARKVRGVRDNRYNAVLYCPDCWEKQRAAYRHDWQVENRQTCRTTNRTLVRKVTLLCQYIERLEERLRK